MLLGQNVNSYGHDREDGSIPHLLDAVDTVPGLERMRLQPPINGIAPTSLLIASRP